MANNARLVILLLQKISGLLALKYYLYASFQTSCPNSDFVLPTDYSTSSCLCLLDKSNTVFPNIKLFPPCLPSNLMVIPFFPTALARNLNVILNFFISLLHLISNNQEIHWLYLNIYANSFPFFPPSQLSSHSATTTSHLKYKNSILKLFLVLHSPLPQSVFNRKSF